MASSSATLSKEYEALIRKFSGLNTSNKKGPIVCIPKQAITSREWSRSVLARVITDRTVLDKPFASAMSKAWGTDSNTTFRPIARNSYLIECCDDTELNRALSGSPWMYRGDVVSVKQVFSHEDLKPDKAPHMIDARAQFYNLPVDCLTEEGARIMASKVGRPISAPLAGIVQGKRFLKIKLMLDVNVALKDRVTLTIPDQEDILVHVSYERISRYCSFCGCLGHEIQGCQEYNKVSLVLRKTDLEPTEVAQILSPKMGLWLTDPQQLPSEGKATAQQAQPNNKRAFNQTGQQNQPLPKLPCPFISLSQNSPTPSTDSQVHVKKPRPAGTTTPAPSI